MWPHSERNVEARDTYRTYQTSSTDVSLFESSRQRLVCSAFFVLLVVRGAGSQLASLVCQFFSFPRVGSHGTRAARWWPWPFGLQCPWSLTDASQKVEAVAWKVSQWQMSCESVGGATCWSGFCQTHPWPLASLLRLSCCSMGCEQKLGDHDRVKKMKEKVASMENQEKNIYYLHFHLVALVRPVGAWMACFPSSGAMCPWCFEWAVRNRKIDAHTVCAGSKSARLPSAACWAWMRRGCPS